MSKRWPPTICSGCAVKAPWDFNLWGAGTCRRCGWTFAIESGSEAKDAWVEAQLRRQYTLLYAVEFNGQRPGWMAFDQINRLTYHVTRTSIHWTGQYLGTIEDRGFSIFDTFAEACGTTLLRAMHRIGLAYALGIPDWHCVRGGQYPLFDRLVKRCGWGRQGSYLRGGLRELCDRANLGAHNRFVGPFHVWDEGRWHYDADGNWTTTAEARTRRRALQARNVAEGRGRPLADNLRHLGDLGELVETGSHFRSQNYPFTRKHPLDFELPLAEVVEQTIQGLPEPLEQEEIGFPVGSDLVRVDTDLSGSSDLPPAGPGE